MMMMIGIVHDGARSALRRLASGLSSQSQDSFTSDFTSSVMTPNTTIFLGGVVIVYIILTLIRMSTSMTVLKTSKDKRPPVAPFGMFECIRYMTSEEQPWFALKAKEKLNGNPDTFILPLPRRPMITGDATLAREILMDPLSIKPKTYQELNHSVSGVSSQEMESTGMLDEKVLHLLFRIAMYNV